jgi:hypothetical protein
MEHYGELESAYVLRVKTSTHSTTANVIKDTECWSLILYPSSFILWHLYQNTKVYQELRHLFFKYEAPFGFFICLRSCPAEHGELGVQAEGTSIDHRCVALRSSATLRFCILTIATVEGDNTL